MEITDQQQETLPDSQIYKENITLNMWVDIVNMGQTQGIYTIEEFINKIQKENICPEKKTIRCRY
jgi:hypothetical protein